MNSAFEAKHQLTFKERVLSWCKGIQVKYQRGYPGSSSGKYRWSTFFISFLNDLQYSVGSDNDTIVNYADELKQELKHEVKIHLNGANNSILNKDKTNRISFNTFLQRSLVSDEVVLTDTLNSLECSCKFSGLHIFESWKWVPIQDESPRNVFKNFGHIRTSVQKKKPVVNNENIVLEITLSNSSLMRNKCK